jgi:amino acid permease
LFDISASTPLGYYLPIVPVCIIAFGFHGSVPS